MKMKQHDERQKDLIVGRYNLMMSGPSSFAAWWDAFYVPQRELGAPASPPSSFARLCHDIGWAHGHDVVDMGAGDGRDSVLLGDGAARVVPVDASAVAVEAMRAAGLRPVRASAAALPLPCELFANAGLAEPPVGGSAVSRRPLAVYSRFSLHSLDRASADAFLRWCAAHAARVAIETRSVNDPRFGRGAPAGDDAFVDTHYRRFTRLSDLTAQLRELGFRVLHAEEDFEAARTPDDAAVVNRVLADRVRGRSD
jgi:predicted RNA methylase